MRRITVAEARVNTYAAAHQAANRRSSYGRTWVP